MDKQQILTEVLEASDRRRAERRSFLRASGSASLAAGSLMLLSACGHNHKGSPTPSPSPSPSPSPTPAPSGSVSDADVLNFALNLEYLEAQFYSHAAFGTSLPANMLDGQGRAGAVKGGKQVPFTDPVVAQYAREIAGDEIAHVAFLRKALGSAAVAQPEIDIRAEGAFTAAAIAAGVIKQGQTFDPYANDENFLLGAFIFEDVGVTAYKGAAPLLASATYVEAAAGILAAEAYHAGLVRTVLYAKGMTTPALITNAGKISDARDSLDGSSDDDQGIATASDGASNIVPADDNGLAYSRTTLQVLNIAYLTPDATSQGGFFPLGVNNANAALTMSGDASKY
ncbi:MAG: ferritin-like domain-containing protein [Sphingomonas sp.]